MDFIHNGQASGSLAATLLANNFDVNAMRPYIGKDGRSYVTQNRGDKAVAVPTMNAIATLRYLDWIQLDRAIVKAAKPRLRAVADLRKRGLEYGIPNGMGKTVLTTERQSDISPAIVSMDGLRQGANDRPVFDTINLPLPIISKDFSYSARQVMASRNGGSPLDTTTAELAARRVAEIAEQMALGTYSQYQFGGGTIQGYTNYTGRMLKVLTAPTASGWTGLTTVQDVLAMILQSRLQYHYGPWVIYNSTDWDQYLDDDYKAFSNITLRQRIKQIEGIEDVRTADYLPVHTMLLVQMTPDVVRLVNGMDITTVQWQDQGGLQLNFKVMCIMVPQIRSDQNGNTGIVHGAY